MNEFSRTEMLFGKAAIERLAQARVAVFGCGGVGGYAIEVLARSAVGAIDLFDNDTVSLTNINRQLFATHSTLGQFKVDVAAQRIADINPQCRVTTHKTFYLVSNADEVDLTVYDYVVDCIDTVTAKMELIRRCHRMNIPIIVCMGAANKVDPSSFTVADITNTRICPLAKVLRKHLRREGITHFKCVYSPEMPLEPIIDPSDEVESKGATGRPAPASNAFVPAAAGILVGATVVKDLISTDGDH